MGWEDRHYNDGGGQGGGGIGRMRSGSIVMWLLCINCAIFILDSILASGSRVGATPYLSYWGSFYVPSAIEGFQVWRFVTYQFLHADEWQIRFTDLTD